MTAIQDGRQLIQFEDLLKFRGGWLFVVANLYLKWYVVNRVVVVGDFQEE